MGSCSICNKSQNDKRVHPQGVYVSNEDVTASVARRVPGARLVMQPSKNISPPNRSPSRPKSTAVKKVSFGPDTVFKTWSKFDQLEDHSHSIAQEANSLECSPQSKKSAASSRRVAKSTPQKHHRTERKPRANTSPLPARSSQCHSNSGARCRVGKYSLYRKIEQARFPSVYEGCTKKNKQTLIFELPHPQPSLEESTYFMNHSDHPNLLQPLDVVQTEHSLYIVAEYAEKDKLTQSVPCSLSTARALFRQLVSALDFLHHTANCVHGSLTPASLYLTEDDTLKVERFTFGSGTISDDIWGCGLCLFYLLTANEYTPQTKIVGLQMHVLTLLTSLLHSDPQERLTLDELKTHDWVTHNGRFTV